MKSVVVIPARYKSSRFPGKPLVSLLGKPMVLWVAELSSMAVGRQSVYVATDDERIYSAVTSAGYNAVMTSDGALTGTDRVAEVAKVIEADIYINVQGDEPLINPLDIQSAIELKKKFPDCVINSYCPLGKSEHESNVNIPKVIFTESGKLVYMSRAVLPGSKDLNKRAELYYKQVCIYAYTRKELMEFQEFGRKSYLESIEDIEIIRFLEWGREIQMFEASSGSLAVDVPGDVGNVEKALRCVQ